MAEEKIKETQAQELVDLVIKLRLQKAEMESALKNPGAPPKYIVHLNDIGLVFKVVKGVPFGKIKTVPPQTALRMGKRESRQYAAMIKDQNGKKAKSSRWEASCHRLIEKMDGYLKIIEEKIKSESNTVSF